MQDYISNEKYKSAEDEHRHFMNFDEGNPVMVQLCSEVFLIGKLKKM